MTGGGRRWLALDADMFGKRFTHDLYNRFGWAGVATWVAFLCACKQSRTPGRIRVMNSIQAMHVLGIAGWELVDNKGESWDLDDFFTFTGRKKQTRRIPVGRRDSERTASGQCFDVDATHWQRWQDDARMQNKREQMRRSRAQKRGQALPRSWNGTSTNVVPDNDLDLDNPPTPLEGGTEALRAEKQNPQNLRAGLESVRASFPPLPPPKKQAR